jgi:hypothetical protein
MDSQPHEPEARGTMLVSIKTVYGTPTIYPACNLSQCFAAVLGQKTLTPANIAGAKSMGFLVKQSPNLYEGYL